MEEREEVRETVAMRRRRSCMLRRSLGYSATKVCSKRTEDFAANAYMLVRTGLSLVSSFPSISPLYPSSRPHPTVTTSGVTAPLPIKSRVATARTSPLSHLSPSHYTYVPCFPEAASSSHARRRSADPHLFRPPREARVSRAPLRAAKLGCTQCESYQLAVVCGTIAPCAPLRHPLAIYGHSECQKRKGERGKRSTFKS